MQLEDEVCSRELSLKLHELGVKHNGLFWWVDVCLDTSKVKWKVKVGEEYKDDPREKHPAYSVGELGISLPSISEIHEDFVCKIYEIACKHDEANARAEIIIFSIENQLMEIPK